MNPDDPDRVNLTLRGQRAERFLEIRREIADRRGVEPQKIPKVEVFSRMTEEWTDDESGHQAATRRA